MAVGISYVTGAGHGRTENGAASAGLGFPGACTSGGGISFTVTGVVTGVVPEVKSVIVPGVIAVIISLVAAADVSGIVAVVLRGRGSAAAKQQQRKRPQEGGFCLPVICRSMALVLF